MARARQNLEEFIIMYKDSPCLWQTSSKDYHDRRKKDAAYGKLVDKIRELEPSANKDFVIKKINNLRSSFRKELKKIKDWMKTGSGAEDVYQPKLWYFELLRFLYEHETPRPPNFKAEKYETESEEENETTLNEYVSERSNEPFDAEDTQSQTARDDALSGKRALSPASRPCPTPPKRTTSMQHVSHSEDVLQSANEHNRTRTQDDRHDVFGKHVANVLRDVSTSQRILAEKCINDVLFQAQMGTLSTSQVFTQQPRNEPPQPQEQEILLNTQSTFSFSGSIPKAEPPHSIPPV